MTDLHEKAAASERYNNVPVYAVQRGVLLMMTAC